MSFDHYREELDKLNLKTKEDLENLVKPLIKEATNIIAKKVSKKPKDSHLKSHFGGQPYFEKGEEWPQAKNDMDKKGEIIEIDGRMFMKTHTDPHRPDWIYGYFLDEDDDSDNYLEFVFQIYNDGNIMLPENIKLLQFFYDFSEPTSCTEDGGWFIKIYETINPGNYLFIKKPRKHNTVKYCEIEFKTIKSLPDWEGIDVYCENAKKLSCVLGELDGKSPWENYQEIAEKLVGEPNYDSQLGGYANWVQSDAEYIDKKEFSLLFQLASEEEPDLWWGTHGCVYVFYNKNTKEIIGELQCS
jgi:uncharacterized protein YwqG